MTKEEREILITACVLKTNYSEEYFEKLSDEELVQFYDERFDYSEKADR